MKQIDENKFSFSARTYNRELDLLLTALDTTKVGVVITDCSQPDYPIVYCNKAFEELTGYSRNEVIGHNCRFLQGNDDNEEQKKVIKTALHLGQPCEIEIKNYKKDGSLFWNQLRLQPIRDEENNVTYYIGVQNDVTRLKLTNQQLRVEKLKVKKTLVEHDNNLSEDEGLLTAVIDTVRDSVLILTENLHIIKVNRSFLKTFHIAEDEVLDQHILGIDNGKWNTMGLQNLAEQLSSKKTSIKDYLLEDFPTRVGKKVLNFDAHFISHTTNANIILAISDITELRELEKRKDDFLSTASHELKTPLTAITASLQLTQRMLPPDASETLKGTLNKTKSYVDKLEHLVIDLLDASKIKTGRIELTKQAFDFDAMILEVVDKLRGKYHDNHFEVQGAASNYYIGDRLRLEQVILNLLTNSIKFSPVNRSINIHLSRLSDFIKVSITDYGLGVDHQYQKKIFDSFYRVDEIQKQYPGIGVGLYISNQIIKKHKGTLWVESTIGEGATFSFTLPLKYQDHDKENYDM
ncbi:PAS domain-containing protein [Olivibacter sp. 47]|uniref:PAS domain-containing protein n=1 Tax=Olivibacter sp. 47 TaxID=3056486 RepID=UPI0025A44125|nr:PAS domain-containing protein [Olivibacter sp. 47]MDM8173830.1 PAS domain-containing protein [Olivibacter sp. 47]